MLSNVWIWSPCYQFCRLKWDATSNMEDQKPFLFCIGNYTSNREKIVLDYCIIAHLRMTLTSPSNKDGVNSKATDSTMGGLTSRRQLEYKNKTKTTIIDISAGYSLIHSKYVQFNNLSFMQTLAPLSMFGCWLVMNVNIALILVRTGLLNNSVETADESPQNRSGSGLGSSCLRKTKEPVKRQSIPQ